MGNFLAATWNCNSIRPRLQRLEAFLGRHKPDVLCLQEIKTTHDQFPFIAIQAAGYKAVIAGQKTYHGVAILARSEPTDVVIGLCDEVDDDQARVIAATVDGVRVMSVYFPNGQAVGSAAWDYKIEWIRRLGRCLQRTARPDQPLLLCGDFNIAVDELDVEFPHQWDNTVLFHPQARAELARLRDWGLVDVFRQKHPEGKIYTWWDYRQLSFALNDGLRLDHIWATAPLAQRCTEAEVDRSERKGPKPSDHAPVVARFEWPP